jgi:hypothetical protein
MLGSTIKIGIIGYVTKKIVNVHIRQKAEALPVNLMNAYRENRYSSFHSCLWH